MIPTIFFLMRILLGAGWHRQDSTVGAGKDTSGLRTAVHSRHALSPLAEAAGKCVSVVASPLLGFMGSRVFQSMTNILI